MLLGFLGIVLGQEDIGKADPQKKIDDTLGSGSCIIDHLVYLAVRSLAFVADPKHSRFSLEVLRTTPVMAECQSVERNLRREAKG